MKSIPKLLLIGLVLLTGVLRAQGQSKPLIRFANEHWITYVLFDLLEVQPSLEGRPLTWDMDGWAGKMYDRIWIRSEGDLQTGAKEGEVEFQALYSRVVAPYWDAQIGARVDLAFDRETTRRRFHLAIGMEGLAPYWFEVEPTLFISQDGDISATLVTSHDVFITQRLIFQPRLEAMAAVQEVPEWGVGEGLNALSLSLRLRYEIRRELAPYIGFQWHRFFGQAADFAREEGAMVRSSGLVLGLRFWY